MNDYVSGDEQPTEKLLKEKYEMLEAVSEILPGFGSTYAKKDTLSALSTVPRKFNELFSREGWIVFDSMDFETMEHCVSLHLEDQKEKALAVLIEYFTGEELHQRLTFLYGEEEIRKRRILVEAAAMHTARGDNLAAIPLLLMTIDGAVNDFSKSGFHSQNLDIDVWDSGLMIGEGICKVRDIFRKGRKKTNVETISMPYRNGILHGMELGYGNKEVLAKSWCYLFVVSDWISAKRSEPERKEKHKKEIVPPKIEDALETMLRTENKKKELKEWSRRDISAEYLKSLSDLRKANSNSPEELVVRFIDLWKSRNFGNMSKFYQPITVQHSKMLIYEVKEIFGQKIPDSYQILSIDEKAPALCEIEVRTADFKNQDEGWLFRLIHEDEEGEPVVSTSQDGKWYIIHAHPKK